MKIKLTEDVAGAQERAKQMIDLHFAMQWNSMRAEAHKRKRAAAELVMSGKNRDAAPALFLQEAQRTGKTVEEFADLILSKPDTFDGLESSRRILIENVRAAKTIAGITDILNSNGIRTSDMLDTVSHVMADSGLNPDGTKKTS